MPDITLGNYEIDEDSNGNLVIKDTNDTVVFQYDDASSTFQPQVEFDFGSNDISNVGSINTKEAETSNETLIRATRSADSGSKSSGTKIAIFDGSSKDIRGEFDGNGGFTPDKSGEYEFIIFCDVRGNTVADDRLNFEVQNSSGTVVGPRAEQNPPNSIAPQNVTFCIDLSAGETYTPKVSNLSSSFEVKANDNTVGIIRRSISQ